MTLLIKYIAECNCGGIMSIKELDLSSEPGDEVVISLELLGDMILECDKCDDRVYVPNVMEHAEDLED